MKYSDFSQRVIFSTQVTPTQLEVNVRVIATTRDTNNVIANVGVCMDRLHNNQELDDAWVSGTTQDTGWDTLVRMSQSMLFYNILNRFSIDDMPTLSDEEMAALLSEGN